MEILKLKVVKIRGIESRGMLCSESELNLSNESDGIIELKDKEKAYEHLIDLFQADILLLKDEKNK